MVDQEAFLFHNHVMLGSQEANAFRKQRYLSYQVYILSLGITASHLSLSSCFLGNLKVFSFLSLS